jgi:hypothetical protein
MILSSMILSWLGRSTRLSYPDRSLGAGQLTARDALRQLRKEARLKPEHAERHLRELREERLAADR